MKMLLRLVVALAAAVAFTGCTDAGRAQATLEASGFSKVEITGYEGFACAEDDNTCTGFRAVGPTGYHVRGAVGCGLTKGCTVRILGAW